MYDNYYKFFKYLDITNVKQSALRIRARYYC